MTATVDRPLRVLHLSHSAVNGGAELALVRMLRAEPEWSPLVLTPPIAPGVFEGLACRRVSGVVQPAGVASAGAAGIAAATANLAVQALATRAHAGFRTADLIHANTTRAAAYGALAARTSRRPFIVHLRDTVDVPTLGAAGHALMTRLALPRADGVIANSAATLRTAEPFLRPDALTRVIPSASGLTVGGARPPRESGPLRIGMLARIDPWKGQHLVLHAFRLAFPHGDEVLQFAGGAPFGHEAYAQSLIAAARSHGLDDRVQLLGNIEDIDPLLDNWDIAVQFSTRPEPLGQNVLQYLAAGCATVVADEGGPVHWVSDGVNGVRIPPRDVDALAAVLRDLAADPNTRERLGAAAAATPGLLDDRSVTAAHAAFFREVHTAVTRR